jgi:serine/threonine protein kinase
MASTHPRDLFQLVEKLGEGSYGAVFRALHIATGRIVAVKVVSAESDLGEVMREIDILKRCRSPFVVQYMGSYCTATELWIVMEHCGGGSVNDLIRATGRPLPEPHIARICAAMLMGLEYLHRSRLIHRDVKAANVLLTADGAVKLGAFAISTCPPRVTLSVGLSPVLLLPFRS